MTAPPRSGAADRPEGDAAREAASWPEFDALLLGAVACDAGGRVVRWNTAAGQLLGEDLLRTSLGAWADHASIRGDDGRPLPASALPFGPRAVVPGQVGERLLVIERAGTPARTLSAVVQPWAAGGADGGSLTLLRPADRARRIADAGRERIDDLERRLGRQLALVRTARVAGSAGEERELLARMLEQLTTDLPSDGTAIIATEVASEAGAGEPAGAGDRPRIFALAGPSNGPLPADILALHDSGAGDWVGEHRRPLTVSAPSLDPFAGPDAVRPFRAWSAVPLVSADGTTIGVLYSVHADERTYDADDLSYLEAVADQAAGAIVRERLIAQLRTQARELSAHRDRLEHLVAERTRDLEETHARLRLADRLAAIGTFTAGLGHDMENVLFPLRCRLDALGPGDRPAEGPLAATLDATQHALGFLRELADGLRLFARDPLDGPADARTPLAAWWNRVAPLIRHALPDSVTLEADLPATLPAVRVPAAGLTQAVLNLAVNAAEAIARRGGGERGGEHGGEHDGDPAGPTGTIRIVAREAPGSPDRIRLSVQDDGLGMSPEVAAQAFDPFFSTRTRTVSTGLGLWLVHQIIERADGRISVDTVPGEGTTITLELPAGAADDAAAGPSGPDPSPGTAGRIGPAATAVTVRVLVADPRRRAWIERLLPPAGCTVLADDDPGHPTILIHDADADVLLPSGPATHVIHLGAAPRPASDPRDSHVHAVPDPDDLGAIRDALSVIMSMAPPR
jgi:signal transduction histidine kinase